MNTRYSDSPAEQRVVKSIQFSILSTEEILKQSVVDVNCSELFDKGVPRDNGLYDLRMGTIDKQYRCQTCHGDLVDCQGHFGHIELAHPVFNICYAKTIHKILQCVCIRCSALLFNETCKLKSGAKRFKWYYDNVKKHATCPQCEYVQPKWSFENMRFSVEFKAEDNTKKDKKKEKKKEQVDENIAEFDNVMVLNILRKISNEDCNKLGFHHLYSHPKSMVIEALPVPPQTVRPFVQMDTNARTQDDLTHKLIEILKCNQQITKNKGAPKHVLDEYINLLQFHITTYIDNDIQGQPLATQRTGRPIKSLGQRIKTKEGRVRGNLMGKRVDFSARTVITAEPNIRLDELGVPMAIAQNMTFAETVTAFNKKFLESCVKNGPEPDSKDLIGAKYVIKNDGKFKKDLRFTQDIELDIGDIVERNMKNGDVVMFNRQPTLHKMSILCHKVRIMEGNTFRMNLSATSSYNADKLIYTMFKIN
jgi:DNA-directed RNA polymerase II subunit RPB1